MTIILLWERPTDERIQKIALSPVTSWALCGLLLTASKPLIYLRFLKSYNYTPTTKSYSVGVALEGAIL